MDLNFDWLDIDYKDIENAVNTVVNYAKQGVEWIAEPLDNIFGEGVGASALTGAVLGGGVAAMLDEDIWTGVGLGAVGFGGFTALDNKFNMTGSNEQYAASNPVANATSPVPLAGAVTEGVDPAAVTSTGANVSQSVIAGQAGVSELEKMQTLYYKKMLGIDDASTKKSDGFLNGLLDFTDSEKKDLAANVIKTGGTLAYSYYKDKQAQEDAAKEDERIYQRDKKKYQEGILAPKARPEINSNYQSSYRSQN